MRKLKKTNKNNKVVKSDISISISPLIMRLSTYAVVKIGFARLLSEKVNDVKLINENFKKLDLLAFNKKKIIFKNKPKNNNFKFSELLKRFYKLNTNEELKEKNEQKGLVLDLEYVMGLIKESIKRMENKLYKYLKNKTFEERAYYRDYFFLILSFNLYYETMRNQNKITKDLKILLTKFQKVFEEIIQDVMEIENKKELEKIIEKEILWMIFYILWKWKNLKKH